MAIMTRSGKTTIDLPLPVIVETERRKEIKLSDDDEVAEEELI